jgi:hypothetical protein
MADAAKDTAEGGGETSPAAAVPLGAPTFSFGAPSGGFAAFGAAGGGFGAPGAGVAFGKPAEEEEEGGEGDAGDAEAECTATFKPLVTLEEVATTTGEEDEEILFEAKAKSYRFAEEWKEKGTGQLKLLQHKTTKKVRLLMRREKTLKICANFIGASRGSLRPLTRAPRSRAPASCAGREAVGAQRQRQGGRVHDAGLLRGVFGQAGDVLHALWQRRQCVHRRARTHARRIGLACGCCRAAGRVAAGVGAQQRSRGGARREP